MDKELQDKLDLIRNDITMMTDAFEDLSQELENDKPRITSTQDIIDYAVMAKAWLLKQDADLTMTHSEAEDVDIELTELSNMASQVYIKHFVKRKQD